MKKLLALATVFTALFLLLVPAGAMAHGTIFTFKYIDGANMVMVTENVHEPQAGLPITYNLRLYSMDGQLVPFETVQAKVTQKAHVVLEKSLPLSANNDVNLTYSYPKQGNYTLAVHFIDNDKQVAGGTFPIAVEKSPVEGFFASAFTAQTLLAFLIGAAATKLYVERKKLKLPRQLRKK
jgi:methionine-rich copper-binding protein CopC